MLPRARQSLEDFFRHLGSERRLSPLTLTHYRRDLSQCVTYCDDAGIAGWEQLTAAEVRGWVSALHRRGLSGKSIQRALSALRSFYRYLLREQAVTGNPASGVSAPRSARRLPDTLTADQTARLVALEARDPLAARDRAILELLYSSGLRLSELVNLNIPELDLAAGSVRVRLLLLDKHPGYGWDGKTDGLNVLASADSSANVAPWEAVRKELELKLPDRPGEATLAAVLTRAGQAPVVSFRPLRIYAPLPAVAKKLKVSVLERGDDLARWLKQRGHEALSIMADQRPDVIIIGDGMLNDSTVRQYQFTLVRRIQDGTRLIVLQQPAWNPGIMEGKILEQLETVSARGPVMTIFPQEGAEELLGPTADYERLNGLDNAAMRTSLGLAPSLAAAKRLSLALTGTVTTAPTGATQPAASAPAEVNPWRPLLCGYSRNINSPDIALAYRTFGKGDVYACQLELMARIFRQRQESFDPVAERLLARLIEGGPPAATTKDANLPR